MADEAETNIEYEIDLTLIDSLSTSTPYTFYVQFISIDELDLDDISELIEEVPDIDEQLIELDDGFLDVEIDDLDIDDLDIDDLNIEIDEVEDYELIKEIREGKLEDLREDLYEFTEIDDPKALEDELAKFEESLEDKEYDMEAAGGVENWFADYAKQKVMLKRIQELDAEDQIVVEQEKEEKEDPIQVEISEVSFTGGITINYSRDV